MASRDFLPLEGFSCLASGLLMDGVGGGRAEVAESSGLGPEREVRLEPEPGPSLPIAWSLESDRAVWRSSHLSFRFWTQPQQMASCRQRTQAEGPSAGTRIHQLLFAKPPEEAARPLWKLCG